MKVKMLEKGQITLKKGHISDMNINRKLSNYKKNNNLFLNKY